MKYFEVRTPDVTFWKYLKINSSFLKINSTFYVSKDLVSKRYNYWRLSKRWSDIYLRQSHWFRRLCWHLSPCRWHILETGYMEYFLLAISPWKRLNCLEMLIWCWWSPISWLFLIHYDFLNNQETILGDLEVAIDIQTRMPSLFGLIRY